VKLFEAFAMAKPVVASDLSGIRDALTNGFNGILVSDNPEQWVRAIEGIIGDREVYDRLAQNAFATAARYDWDLLSRIFQSGIENSLS
jgi:glycosyltransferase involved in cell wall biosynthesis